MSTAYSEYKRLQSEARSLLQSGNRKEAEIAIGVANQFYRDYQASQRDPITVKDVEILESIWELFDQIADGAPDASYAAKTANRLEEPLQRIIGKLKRGI